MVQPEKRTARTRKTGRKTAVRHLPMFRERRGIKKEGFMGNSL
jgi:hypothetical protein